MVKKDSKKSQSFFQYQNSSQQTTSSSQFMPQHFNFQSCKSVLLKIYKVQFRHQNVQFSYNTCPDLSKNRGGGFYWRKYGKYFPSRSSIVMNQNAYIFYMFYMFYIPDSCYVMTMHISTKQFALYI